MVEPAKSRVVSDETYRQIVTPGALFSRLDAIVHLLWRRVAKRKVSFEISKIEGDMVRVKTLGGPRQRDPYVWMGVGDSFTLTWKTELGHEITFEEPNG